MTVADDTGRGLRLGAVRYLNALPLLVGIDDDPRVALVDRDVPAALAKRLVAGELDAILGPAVLLATIAGLELLDAPVIACDGSVRSVLVHSRVPIDSIRTVRRDPASRTSNELCRQVFEALAVTPTFVDGDSPSDCDAFVVIGDAAFAPPPPDHPVTLDLGAAWKEQTGLPFVFAGWLARAGHAEATAVVRDAAGRGLARRAEIAREHAGAHGVTSEEALSYLTKNILFDLTYERRAGLERFLAAARQSLAG